VGLQKLAGQVESDGGSPLLAVGVYELKCGGIVRRAGVLVGDDRFLANRFAGNGEPLLPLWESGWLVFGEEQEPATGWAATVLHS
jgi:hypothetical protein